MTITNSSFHITFSSMLVKSQEVLNLYIPWVSVFGVTIIIYITYMVEYGHFEIIKDIENSDLLRADTIYRLNMMYAISSGLYVAFELLIIPFLVEIAVFPVNSRTGQHYESAGLAFGCAILAQCFLFLRRISLRVSYFRNIKNCNFNGTKLYLISNLLYLLALILLVIFFAANPSGETEFFLILLIIIGFLFQVRDFYHDAVCTYVQKNDLDHEKLAIRLVAWKFEENPLIEKLSTITFRTNSITHSTVGVNDVKPLPVDIRI